MNRIDLGIDWKVRFEELDWGTEKLHSIDGKKDGWFQVNLPCDVHMPLIENSIIKEPLEKDNSFSCEWTEDKSWWFMKKFSVDTEIFSREVIELTLESLDAEADIFLNGVHLGRQKSAFYPFVKDIKEQIKMGENDLIVRLTSGVEYYSDSDLAGLKKYINTEADGGKSSRGDKRRAFVRKPQYVFGWDWGPRVATCGIVKGAWINAYDKLSIKSIYAVTKSILPNTSISSDALISFEIEIENCHSYSTLDAFIKLELYFEDKRIIELQQNVFLRSGRNFINFEALIKDAKLWWPNGMGEQPLYTVKVSSYTEATAADEATNTFYPDFKFGIRTIIINQEKLLDNERKFEFVVNGVRVFCKGANWIPADSIYARVKDDQYDTLIRQAKNANFNMLRVWGGGIYERDIFYQKCDQYGIMLWHDFMFACSAYPENYDWFQQEVEKEMDYQTIRLRNHASMALWCGNNEIHWAFDEWWSSGDKPLSHLGAGFYNNIAPQIVQKNCRNIPYWNSSPYGGEHPNGDNAGDKHHWFECMMNPDMEKRISPEEYDKINAKFVSEYGYIGPCCKSSITQYFSGEALDRNSHIWQLHNNNFEKDTVAAGITKHYTDSEKLDIDGYLLYAGLCQGLMYGYSLEALRFKENCGGALFWMYNDCWGEVGWTIIDYYLKRKISYYFVKRAFEPVKIIMRQEQGSIKVIGINETPNTLVVDFKYGYVSFDGRNEESNTITVEITPYSRKSLFEFEKSESDLNNGIYFVKPFVQESAHENILPIVLNQGNFREWNIKPADVKVMDFKNEHGVIEFTVSSETYAHAVHFNLEDNLHLSDEYFDLLPGESRNVTIYNAPEKFKVEHIIPQCV